MKWWLKRRTCAKRFQNSVTKKCKHWIDLNISDHGGDCGRKIRRPWLEQKQRLRELAKEINRPIPETGCAELLLSDCQLSDCSGVHIFEWLLLTAMLTFCKPSISRSINWFGNGTMASSSFEEYPDLPALTSLCVSGCLSSYFYRMMFYLWRNKVSRFWWNVFLALSSFTFAIKYSQWSWK